MAHDLSQEAQVVIQVISEDRRSLRFKHQIDLKDFDFDDEIELRLFKAEDVVLITFIDDLEEFYVSLKCCELPLSLDEKMTWFAQIKTKQVKVDLQLYQDEALIPLPSPEETAAQAKKPKDVDAENLKIDIKNKAEAFKDQQEFQEKVKQLQGKSDAQKGILLKKFINDQKLKNRKMITK